MGCMGGCGGGKKSTPQQPVKTGAKKYTQRPSGSIQGYAGFGKPKIKLTFGRGR